MNIYSRLLILLLFPVTMLAQDIEIKDTPQEYIEHVAKTWSVNKENIVYVTNKTTLTDLASVIHTSLLSFVKGELSTAAEILDGRRTIDPAACGLPVNNLDIENVKKHLKTGNDYRKIHFKRVKDNSDFKFSDKLTSVLLYSKKLDYFLGDYFKVMKEFSKKDADYIIIVFDNEVSTQIPGALKN